MCEREYFFCEKRKKRRGRRRRRRRRREKNINIYASAYNNLDDGVTCKSCRTKQYKFVVYQCDCTDQNVNRRFFCFGYCSSKNIRHYTCMNCAGSRYITDISKWFNKCSLQGIGFYRKITTQS